LFAVLGFALLSGCGGGGGGGSAPPPTPAPDLFLFVSSPYKDGQIFNSDSITVSGQTTVGAQVKINGVSVTVDGGGNFRRSGVAISSNPTAIVVRAALGDASFTITRNVYYDDRDHCRMVYVAVDYRTGRDRIYAMAPDIPGSSRLIYDDLPGWSHGSPALAPGAANVFFVRGDSEGNQYIVRMPCSGSGSPAALTSAVGVHYRGLSVSHDGTKIAFASDAEGQYDIYTMNISGGAAVRVASHAAMDDSPSWLASGDGLVFASYRDAGGGPGAGEVSNLWKITTSPLEDEPELLYDPSGPGAPACSRGAGNCSAKNPDVSAGGRVIFQFEDACPARIAAAAPPSASCSRLFVMSSIAADPAPATSGTSFFSTPHWNAGGDAVVFVESTAGNPGLMLLPFTGAIPGTALDLNVAGSQPDH